MAKYLKTISTWLVVITLVTLLAMASSGLGAKYGLWHWKTGFSILKWTTYTAIALCISGQLIIILGLIFKKTREALMGALVAAVLAMPLFMIYQQWNMAYNIAPVIHDITTDWQDVPQFIKVVELRKNAKNSLEYTGGEVIQKQQQAYPYVKPIQTSDDVKTALTKSQKIAEKFGWQIHAVHEDLGLIEATETTTWFGFKDDVVIRIRTTDSGSKIDLRSISRVGASDVGANAARIKKFIDAYTEN